MPTSGWRAALNTGRVDVVPLVDDGEKKYAPGWCVYENTLSQAPEIEFICGGINTKTPQAAGVWRQGNFLHFGFEQSPAEMNDTGNALLVNCIAYIARFTEDRPTEYAVSPFVGSPTRPRWTLVSWLRAEDFPYASAFEDRLEPAVRETITDRTPDGYRAWYRENGPYLCPGDGGLLALDEQAKALGAPYDKPVLFERGIAALGDPATRDAAAAVLHRYAPQGPDTDDAGAWAAWYESNEPYLFYSEIGGFRWYVDPLAKARRVPSRDLRGPDRAD